MAVTLSVLTYTITHLPPALLPATYSFYSSLKNHQKKNERGKKNTNSVSHMTKTHKMGECLHVRKEQLLYNRVLIHIFPAIWCFTETRDFTFITSFGIEQVVIR
eukprot:TRINITY_DN7038_c0_g1_i1.p1 TRINITY_DN7038_c0_g1~~TRINITY_DN7038_c0_g1_i1.p1  ORF type:complete len:104 (+),score=2.15 TRINITY_DN7038_c0_g1_i1:56-367(+)